MHSLVNAIPERIYESPCNEKILIDLFHRTAAYGANFGTYIGADTESSRMSAAPSLQECFEQL